MQRRWWVALVSVFVLVAAMATAAGGTPRTQVPTVSSFLFRSIDGSGNNLFRPTWGQAGTNYLPRRAHALRERCQLDRRHRPNARYVSNRVFNDLGQNLFSENDISQWGWAWGQFLDHDFGLRDETPAESNPIPFVNGATRSSRSRTTWTRSTSRGRRPRPVPASRRRASSATRSRAIIDGSVVYGSDAARSSGSASAP